MLALLLALALPSAVVALPLGEQTIPAVPAEAAAPAACAANWTNGDVTCCNLPNSQAPTSQAQCCMMCTANPRCAAAVWNAGTDKWCTQPRTP